MEGPRGTTADALSADALDAMLAEPDPRTGDDQPARPLEPAHRAALQELLNAVESEPWVFGFAPLLRRIEAIAAGTPGFGISSRASEDPVRFGQPPSLAFATTTIEGVERSREGTPRVDVNFLGMLGPHGPLPLHLTEYAGDRVRHAKDATFVRFLDLFNNRMVGLFYRTWAASQMPCNFDRWEAPPAGADVVERRMHLARDRDRYALYIGSLFGLGMESMRHRDAVPDLAKLHFVGRLATPHRNPEGLAAILRDFFGTPVAIEEFAGRWIRVPREELAPLGDRRGDGASGMLGGPLGGIVTGERVWDCSGAVRLRLGPMGLSQYERLLPGAPGGDRLAAWMRNYLGDELWWEATLILRKDEVPRARLGAGARLGYTTWIRSGADADADRADVRIRSRLTE